MRHMGEVPKEDDKSVRIFYQQMILGLVERYSPHQFDARIAMWQAHSEHLWYVSGKPYYKIWPTILPALTNIKIDRVPCQMFRTKHPQFEIRLPANEPFREHENAPALKSILVCMASDDSGPRLPVQWMWTESRGIIIWMDFGETSTIDGVGGPVATFARFDMPNDIDIETAFSMRRPTQPDAGYFPSDEFLVAIIKLIVGVGFFSVDEHEMVLPDLPRKLVESYDKADNAQKKDEILKKARKKLGYSDNDKGGWTMGREITLPRPIGQSPSSVISSDGDRSYEFHYGHITGPYFRLQRYGPKDDPSKQYVSGITVKGYRARPDLPLKPRGYNIK